MKMTINGSGVTPEKIQSVLVDIEREYDVKIRDLTLYLRLVDERGKFVEPKLPANASELVITIDRPAEDEPLGWKDLLNMVERKIGSKLHGNGIKIVASMAYYLRLTKAEAEQILNSFEERPTVRDIEKKAKEVARRRGDKE